MYDAVIVGSGPNGLAAAIVLQQAGLSVLLIEGKETIGGGMRSEALTLPGFVHDVCSAVHPLAASSPLFLKLPLAAYGLEFLQPAIPAAHPFDDGRAAALYKSLNDTAAQAPEDQESYRRLMEPLLAHWPDIVQQILGPLRAPAHPLPLTAFGLKALRSAKGLGAGRFKSDLLRGLFSGMAAHAMLPLDVRSTAAIGLVLMLAGHHGGWPVPRGGASTIAQALVDHFKALGGEVVTGMYVRSLEQLPAARATLLDVTPRQLLEIAGHRLSSLYRWQLNRYRYGMGVFKIDWAIEGAVPFTNPLCRQAGTVHLGNTAAEVMYSEQQAANGRHAEKPFVLLAQPGVVDDSRAPAGKQAIWGYCHVPHGSRQDMTAAIEQQVERFAPGFRDRILARHIMDSAAMEAYNPNYVGGDINGGMQSLSQLFTRPALRRSPYRTSLKGLYLCSSATPPGGGVHGMCGYYAARRALRDIFKCPMPL